MKEKLSTWLDKFAEVAQKFSSLTVIKAITNGFMVAMPFIMVGSICTLINSIPYDPYTNFLAETGLKTLFSNANQFTMGIVALIVAFSVAYHYTIEKGQKNGVAAGFVSVCCFLISNPMVALENGSMTINIGLLGSSNMFTGIIVGVVSSLLFTYLVDRGFTIKMPESVPPETMKAFLSLIPAFVVIVVFAVIDFLFGMTSFRSFSNLVTQVIQTPLMGFGGTVWTLLLFYLLSNAVWFTGIHGIVVMSILEPILLTLDMQNVAAVEAGNLAVSIIGNNFKNVYAGMSGAGITIGLAILMMFFARSKRYKTVGKISLVPGLFCINEPIIFGTPIMFNVIMIIPFICLPLISIFVAYGLTSIGVLPILSGVQLPWSTPCVLLGFLLGGWRVALYQVFLIILSVAVYYPFFKKIDNQAYLEETQS